MHGKLFQGRYKSLIIEEDAYLGALQHYVHLNPVRAGMCTVDELKAYRWSSYWYLWQPGKRPGFMDITGPLEHAGGLKDTPAGRKKYRDYLQWLSANRPAQKEMAFDRMCRGWALGTKPFKKRWRVWIANVRAKRQLNFRLMTCLHRGRRSQLIEPEPARFRQRRLPRPIEVSFQGLPLKDVFDPGISGLADIPGPLNRHPRKITLHTIQLGRIERRYSNRFIDRLESRLIDNQAPSSIILMPVGHGE